MQVYIKFGLYFLSLFFICWSGYLEENFGHPSIDQIIFHLTATDIKNSDSYLAIAFFRQCIALPFMCSLILTFFERFYKRNYRIYLILFSFSFLYIAWDLALIDYLKNKFSNEEKDFISKNYIDPNDIKIIPSEKLKNLVLIYVESLENTYNQEKLFGKNLIKDLEEIDGYSFSLYKQAPGTDWTTAGIIATQCGMPLKVVALFSGQENLEEGYYPNLICLGNILKKNGYKNVFLGGASINFGRKGKFLSSHGYDENYGRDEWINLGADRSRMNEWGVFDDYLFAQAKVKLRELYSKKELFNLTLLTVEMHYPKGYYSPTCIARGAETYEDIIECASYQVKEFVNFIKNEGMLENTNVVIIGDHLSPISLTKEKLPPKETRTIFNKFISLDKKYKNREEILHFDLFPSILEFIGFEVRGGRLGLGFSGFTNNLVPQAYRTKEVMNKLLPKQDRYNEFLKTVVPGHEELEQE